MPTWTSYGAYESAMILGRHGRSNLGEVDGRWLGFVGDPAAGTNRFAVVRA